MLGFPLLSPRLGFGLCMTAGIIAKVGLSLSYQQLGVVWISATIAYLYIPQLRGVVYRLLD